MKNLSEFGKVLFEMYPSDYTFIEVKFDKHHYSDPTIKYKICVGNIGFTDEFPTLIEALKDIQRIENEKKEAAKTAEFKPQGEDIELPEETAKAEA